MKNADLIALWSKHPNLPRMRDFFVSEKEKTLHLNGLTGSSASVLLAALAPIHRQSRLIILPEREEAAYFHNDLAHLLGDEHVFFFPSTYKRAIRMQQIDKDNVLMRTEVLNKLATPNVKPLIVTYPEALLERVVSRKELQSHTLHVKPGEKIDMDFMIDLLQQYGFQRSDFVWEPGQYAVRGGIIDVFSYSAEHPYRIDFIGDEVETIRSFDVETQLSSNKLERISIIPNLNDQLTDGAIQTLFEFLPENSQVWTRDLTYSISRMENILQGIDISASDDLRRLSEAVTIDEEEGMVDPAQFRKKLVDVSELLTRISRIQLVEFGQKHFFPSVESLFFNTSPQPAFNKNFELLKEKIILNKEDGYRTFLLSDNPKQLERLKAILDPDEKEKQGFETINTTLHEGFYDHDLRVALFTDHQIFERYHKFKVRTSFGKKEAINMQELTDLHPGDYVVHVDHGIGQFGGLETIEINGKRQEAVRLVYRDQDVLYVSIHSLHRISKYKGREGESPHVHKLGSGSWQALKARAKSKIKDIARELIELYAKRKSAEGFAFSPDSYLQYELEASFLYEDTPDQYKATADVKADMESENPMDRLVCGDVGFGKTEVAVRAAFKAVTDSKQVAVLVPTTILALQHYKTFRERLKEFPANVEYTSRLRSAKDQHRVLKELEDGKIDILIGTHKLIGKSIKFKDLGLLIIDEEQKFGVAVKEKLRQMKLNVDTLTLTATPIPRTLQFSMMGARDLSIINTPPPNRHPIITELFSLNEELVRDVIDYELSRDGQVFIIHNRVQNIGEVEAMVNRVVPKARTVVAHGQMEGQMLEDRMLGFINGDYDILIATSIIENGLDIPNANTIIINNAHHFGLSDLHQLRGRVGRSNKRAFCYLIAPPLHLLTPEARRRLKAVADFSELGSGFNIALQDLDIRGAGNLLGAEQSGFIADIGFETYQKILAEAMQELQEADYLSQPSSTPESPNSEFGTLNSNLNLSTSGLSPSDGSIHLTPGPSPAHAGAQINLTPGPSPALAALTGEGSGAAAGFSPARARRPAVVQDTTVDCDLEVLFPEEYVESTRERVRLYRELDETANEPALETFARQLVDRFGQMPPQTVDLLNVVRLRWAAREIGIERIQLKNSRMVCYFISNQNSPYYQSPEFSRVLQFVQKHPKTCRMKEAGGKLTLSFEGIKEVRRGLEIIRGI
ncbi:MAG: transcription-repair coupling factor [Bacteroidales bacterium]|jgi:transcription-repair coupling factor (superfamily II helicase)